MNRPHERRPNELVTVACLSGDDPDRAAALPKTAGLARDEVIVWRGQRSGVREARARLVEIGPGGDRAGPGHSVGRPAKVGKEELVGLLAVVELALAGDEAATRRGYEEMVAVWLAGLEGLTALPGVRLERDPESHSGQPIARAIVRLSGPGARDAGAAALWASEGKEPRIAVLLDGADGFALNPRGWGRARMSSCWRRRCGR